MTKRISAHGIEEFTSLLDASVAHSISEHPSVVFVFATHPQLGEIVGVSTPHENFVLTNGA
jgi:hypothetical protein